MSQRTFARLSALGGLFGVVILITSFIVNPGPPQEHPTMSQLATFGDTYHTQILVGAWMQAVGTVLCIVFALALVHLEGATTRFAGWLTLYGGTLLVTTSLIEVAFYLSAVTGAYPTIALISMDIIHAIQRLYFIVTTTAIFLPLGIVVLGGRTLPKVFGYTALVIAAAFTILGIADLFVDLQAVDNVVGSIQGVWWLAASVALLVFAGRFPAARGAAPQREPAHA
ncbi:MAG TPA: hypothetical protein VF812_05325 [Ktedonobacterales bacterium]